MVEREPIGKPKVITYSGYFKLKEVDRWIDNFLREKGYDKQDVLYEEQHLPEGNQLVVHKEPYKNVTHYTKYLLVIDMIGHHIKPVTITKNGKKHKLEDGEITITISPFLQMDWQHKWTANAWMYFLARYMDKYIQWWYTKLLIKGLNEEREQLSEQLQRFFNIRLGANDG